MGYKIETRRDEVNPLRFRVWLEKAMRTRGRKPHSEPKSPTESSERLMDEARPAEANDVI